LPARLARMSFFGPDGSLSGIRSGSGIADRVSAKSKTVIYAYYSGAYFWPEYDAVVQL